MSSNPSLIHTFRAAGTLSNRQRNKPRLEYLLTFLRITLALQCINPVPLMLACVFSPV